MSTDVSILMPVFNGMPYIHQAVQSVLDQTLHAWQCVIVDDGSRDDTPGFLATLRDHRFLILHQKNAGISAAVNRGLRHCTGRYIARLDADDIALPTRLADQLAFLDTHPGVALVGTQVAPLGACSVGPSLKLPTQHDDIMNALRTGRHAVAHSSVMIRADVLRQIGGYWSLAFGEEYDLMLRIGEIARLANLDRVLLHYRMHQSSMNGSAMRRMRTSVLYACELARRRQNALPPISFEDFQADRNARSRWQRLAEAIDIHARNQYRVALAELYGGRHFRGAARLAWAAACAPQLTFERLIRIAKPSRRRPAEQIEGNSGATG
ncbi:MAG TPA: glycosyltransferase [Lacipirellulaceae bacterium]|nr:glycosyltransferase [Lacipirellulaceae bacterium]